MIIPYQLVPFLRVCSGTFHSRHHRLYVPYAFGALYNHPFEGLLMDTIGAGIAYKISGLTVRGGIFFFTFSTMKTVDDHSGYSLPFDPLQYFFWNNASYHDVHHQGWGIKVRFYFLRLYHQEILLIFYRATSRSRFLSVGIAGSEPNGQGVILRCDTLHPGKEQHQR